MPLKFLLAAFGPSIQFKPALRPELVCGCRGVLFVFVQFVKPSGT
jgi:hypothetical protein